MDALGHARGAINLVTPLDDLVDTSLDFVLENVFYLESSLVQALEHAQEATNLVTLLDVHVGITRDTVLD